MWEWLSQLLWGVPQEEAAIAIRQYWTSHRELILRIATWGAICQLLVFGLQFQPWMHLPSVPVNQWLYRSALTELDIYQPYTRWSLLGPPVLVYCLFLLPTIANYPAGLENRSLSIPRRLFAAGMVATQVLMIGLALTYRLPDYTHWDSNLPDAFEWLRDEVAAPAGKLLLPGLVLASLLPGPLKRPREFKIAATTWLTSTVLLSITDLYSVPVDGSWMPHGLDWVLYIRWPLAIIAGLLILYRPTRCHTFCLAVVTTTILYLAGMYFLHTAWWQCSLAAMYLGAPSLGLLPERDLIGWIIGLPR